MGKAARHSDGGLGVIASGRVPAGDWQLVTLTCSSEPWVSKPCPHGPAPRAQQLASGIVGDVHAAVGG